MNGAKKLYSRMGKHNVIKFSSIFKLICRFRAIQHQLLTGFFFAVFSNSDSEVHLEYKIQKIAFA